MRFVIFVPLFVLSACGGGVNSSASTPSQRPVPPSSLVLVEHYHDDGRPAERGYADSATNARYGAWQFWFDNGQLQWEGSYSADAIDRSQPWREFNRDGSVRRDWQDE